jgi:hypothetical protein
MFTQPPQIFKFLSVTKMVIVYSSEFPDKETFLSFVLFGSIDKCGLRHAAFTCTMGCSAGLIFSEGGIFGL